MAWMSGKEEEIGISEVDEERLEEERMVERLK